MSHLHKSEQFYLIDMFIENSLDHVFVIDNHELEEKKEEI